METEIGLKHLLWMTRTVKMSRVGSRLLLLLTFVILAARADVSVPASAPSATTSAASLVGELQEPFRSKQSGGEKLTDFTSGSPGQEQAFREPLRLVSKDRAIRICRNRTTVHSSTALPCWHLL